MARGLGIFTTEMVNDGIKTVATRSAWMLGVLVLVIFGLASFISKYLDAELQAGNILWALWHTAVLACLFYMGLLVIYIYPLIVPLLGDFNNESDLYRLKKLITNFKTLIALFAISIPAFLVLALGLWVFAQ